MSLVPHPCRHPAPSRPSASRCPRRQVCRGPFGPCRSRGPSHGCAPPTATPQARRLSSHACGLLPSAFVSWTRAFSRLRAHHRVLGPDRSQRGEAADPGTRASVCRPVSQHPCQPGIRRTCSRGERCCASCLAHRPCPRRGCREFAMRLNGGAPVTYGKTSESSSTPCALNHHFGWYSMNTGMRARGPSVAHTRKNRSRVFFSRLELSKLRRRSRS
jgi:hypothetical protein